MARPTLHPPLHPTLHPTLHLTRWAAASAAAVLTLVAGLTGAASAEVGSPRGERPATVSTSRCRPRPGPPWSTPGGPRRLQT